MNRRLSVVFIGLLAANAFSVSIVGPWQSDCQNVSANSEGYLSQRPIDTFGEDLTVSLRIHVYERRNCSGREWDLMTIPCRYQLGKAVEGLSDTKELDLVCQFEGKEVTWYEIAQVKDRVLLYGNQTGETPETRPTELGTVAYRRMVRHSN